MNNLFLLKTIHLTHSTYRLNSTSIKPSIISRIRYVLNHYWLGSKLLYRNSRRIQQIRKKNEDNVTRNERLFLDQYHYDIRVGIPFVALFSIPIVGYSAPLLAILGPKYLPSTLIMPTQKVKFLREDANVSSTIIDSFVKFNQNRFHPEITYGMIPSIQLINEILISENRFERISSSIPEYSSLFHRCYPLSLFPREHLLKLHQSVLHSSFLTHYFSSNYKLESQLEMWQYRTLIDDKQLKPNLEKCSPYDLVVSLCRRGLYLHVEEMGKVLENEQINQLNQTKTRQEINEKILNDWKELLHQWIEIHLKLNKFNPISTSFLLHISPLLVKQ
ncbi:unnamed protein product [Adineta ricciae]|uniref:Letm1 RBD domain-containing protein n=1 Tax=Adineta ricciae TaxID=249248 RepID=A0A813ZW56_ADIRI|nr:unnamed protein product [Adineta ricciae]CAF1367245.1 unnamed protein product [Adineta ricciae]